MLLRVNQILNRVDDRCMNFRLAVSDFDGIADLELSPTNFGDHRIRRPGARLDGGSVHGEEQWQTRETTVRRIDTLFSENDVDVGAIGIAWIDTQGHEGHVLQGASRLLDAGIPIVAEFWPYGLKRSGGYAKLREALQGVRKVYELRASIQERRPIELSFGQLDRMFDDFIHRETAGVSPHTDLLLV
jgi:FkbM family methyltransferase